MSEQRFELGKAPHIIISAVHRDLVVKGWGEMVVSLEGDQVSAEESEKGLVVTSVRDLMVMVPHGASVSVLQCHRDVVIKGIEGELVIGEVQRDMVVRSAGQVEIGHVHHDLVVRSANGAVQIAQVNGDLNLRDVGDVSLGVVHGDVSGRDVDGSFIVKEIMGDLTLRGVTGNVNLGVVHRDVTLKSVDGLINLAQGMSDVRLFGPVADGKHQLHCQRDMVLRWPVNLPLTITATAPSVKDRLGLEDVVEENETVSGRIGEGGPHISLSAERAIVLKPMDMVDEKWVKFAFDDGDFDVDINGLGEKISTEVNRRMDDVRKRMSQMSAEMEARMGTEFAGRFEAQAQQWAEKAERMAEKALQQAEKALKQTRQKAAAAPSAPTPAPGKATVSPEEKLKILKMLEKGVITVEEANNLLSALEQ